MVYVNLAGIGGFVCRSITRSRDDTLLERAVRVERVDSEVEFLSFVPSGREPVPQNLRASHNLVAWVELDENHELAIRYRSLKASP